MLGLLGRGAAGGATVSGANVDGVVVEADVSAAQAVLDGLVEFLALQLPQAKLLELRGYLAGWSADVRTAGYLEGHQVGARATSRLVLDALDGEGLL